MIVFTSGGVHVKGNSDKLEKVQRRSSRIFQVSEIKPYGQKATVLQSLEGRRKHVSYVQILVGLSRRGCPPTPRRKNSQRVKIMVDFGSAVRKTFLIIRLNKEMDYLMKEGA